MKFSDLTFSVEKILLPPRNLSNLVSSRGLDPCVLRITSVCSVDAGFSGGPDAGGAGRVVANAATCRGVVDFGAADARSSAGRAAVIQVLNVLRVELLSFRF